MTLGEVDRYNMTWQCRLSLIVHSVGGSDVMAEEVAFNSIICSTIFGVVVVQCYYGHINFVIAMFNSLRGHLNSLLWIIEAILTVYYRT